MAGARRDGDAVGLRRQPAGLIVCIFSEASQGTGDRCALRVQSKSGVTAKSDER